MSRILFAASFIIVIIFNTQLSFTQHEIPTAISGGTMQQQEEDIFKTKTLWGVGGYGGLLSGIGLSVRFHPAGRFCVQLTGGAMKFNELMYNAGLEAQFDFDSKGRSRFYGYLGGGYYNIVREFDKNGTKEKENRLAAPARLGLGIAYEWAISEKLVFNLNAAFTYFTDGTILPLPQIGFYYYFN